MSLLLSLLKSYWPQIAALVGATALGFLAAWQLQGLRLDDITLDFQRYRLDAEQSAAQAQRASLEKERFWIAEKENALVNARYRETLLRHEIAGAQSAASGLRDDIAALRARLATDSRESCVATAAALGDVLQRCSADYRAMAEVADRHASDVQTLSEAWPR